MSDEKNLTRLFRALPDPDKRTLLAFAEFLAARALQQDATEAVPFEPVAIPRPQQESVVKAIKRLMATYPMLDRGKLLNETSACMTQHVIRGQPAVQCIDELEAAFTRHYETFRSDR